MTQRENFLRAMHFETPEYIPMVFHINDSCWQNYDQAALFDLVEAHPFLFPDYKRPEGKYQPEFAPVARADEPFTDNFGCLWKTTEDGIVGTVVKHPLGDWDKLDGYIAPDSAVCSGIGPMNWEKERRRLDENKAKGRIALGSLRHGHTFLQLCDIRGYENLMFDFADDEPQVWKLIDLVESFNADFVRRFLDIGAEVMGYPEDLGMQVGPMLSPDHFRRYIKPSYQRLMKLSKDRGVPVYMHSDGDIKLLLDDIIEGGVDIMNMQDLVNGVDWIASRFKGKTCVELDIDRQAVTPFGTPREIDKLIKNEVQAIGAKQGGLMMIYGLYPNVPIENVAALMDAMEKYAFYYT